MADYYVYSTLTSPNTYVNYVPGGADIPIEHSRVTIKGGANLATRGTSLTTPKGIVTKVTDAQMSELKRNTVFNLHLKNGFITFEETKENPNKVAKNMTSKDNSAPKRPEDFPEIPSAKGASLLDMATVKDKKSK